MALTKIEIPDHIDGPPFLLAFESDELGIYVTIIFACLLCELQEEIDGGLLYPLSVPLGNHPIKFLF